ncbi:MAG: tRNA (guanosine(37)-N1)-methyltransferase TrmD [Spirochaetes bacterium]|nr:MAG: tRNA (guanosine(37)-N1)-methyltransferase TrmD [Spirochaetota bacterium]
MRFHILTLFPEIMEGYFSASVMARAIKKRLIDYNLINIRNFAEDKHKTCDDYPYGGGAGMVLKPEPMAMALDSIDADKLRTIYPTPGGKLFSQEYAEKLAEEKELIIICGRYEGIDQRIIDLYVDDEISLGDYILSSGEIAALVIVDVVSRLIEGVINRDSLEEESFSNGILEYPHYTRPVEFRGLRVPDILLSGHHAEIEKWRLKQGLEKTMKNRPDLLQSGRISDRVERILREFEHNGGKNGAD